MRYYFLNRLLLLIPTFIGITLVVFTITRFVPGGPIERILTEGMMQGSVGQQSYNNTTSGHSLSDEQIQQLKVYYGFDKPIIIGYGIWLKKILSLDLGVSSRYSEPVWDIIKERLPVSIFYGFWTMLITYIVCIPLGMAKAIKHQTGFDNLTSAIIFTGYAIPGYVVAIALLSLFAAYWEWFPLGGFTSYNFDELTPLEKVIDILHHAALPLTAYLAGSFAVTTFMMKNALMENLAADYIRTAVAKGLPFKRAIFKHALQNSLIPIATSFGQNIGFILTGSFLIETIFNINGIGLLGYESIVERDYPVVMGILAISSVLYLLGNVLSDFCVALIDPRVRFQ